MYARWTGSEWVVHELTAAGGSISDDGKEPFYSGGLTLDHEDPSTVYLSRPVDGNYEIETWTTADGGATWTSKPVTAQSGVKNVRPVSPRGLRRSRAISALPGCVACTRATSTTARRSRRCC